MTIQTITVAGEGLCLSGQAHCHFILHSNKELTHWAVDVDLHNPFSGAYIQSTLRDTCTALGSVFIQLVSFKAVTAATAISSIT